MKGGSWARRAGWIGTVSGDAGQALRFPSYGGLGSVVNELSARRLAPQLLSAGSFAVRNCDCRAKQKHFACGGADPFSRERPATQPPPTTFESTLTSIARPTEDGSHGCLRVDGFESELKVY